MVNVQNKTSSRGKDRRITTAAAAGGSEVKPLAEMPAEAGFRALIRMTGLLDRVMQPFFGGFGISRSQWGVLRILQRAEESGLPGFRLMDLGERLIVRPPSITGLISRMERLGYVVRDSSIDDLRGRVVFLTDAGRELIDRVLLKLGGQITFVMGALGSQEQRQLLGLLDRLSTHLDDMAQGRIRAEFK
jgi:DNA-binding MarR family transcriptional regulator